VVNYADLQAQVNTNKKTARDSSIKTVSDASNDNDHKKVGNHRNDQHHSNMDIKHDIHDNDDNDYNTYHESDNRSKQIPLRSILKRVSFSESSTKCNLDNDQRGSVHKVSNDIAGKQVRHR
jgi:hypothetical protein